MSYGKINANNTAYVHVCVVLLATDSDSDFDSASDSVRLLSVIIRCVCVYRHALKKHSSAGLAATETNGQTDRQSDGWMDGETERRTDTTKASLTLTLYGGTKVKPQNDA